MSDSQARNQRGTTGKSPKTFQKHIEFFGTQQVALISPWKYHNELQ